MFSFSSVAVFVLTGVFMLTLTCQAIKPSYNLCKLLPGFFTNGDYFPEVGDTALVYINLTNPSYKQEHHCSMTFTTCSGCKFRVTEHSSFTFQTCLWTNIFTKYNGKCAPGCTYLHMFDLDYVNETAKSFTSTMPAPYDTLSRRLKIIVCSNRSMVNTVQLSLNLTVVEKVQYIRGSSYDGFAPAYFTSPAFPAFYTENDETYRYNFLAVNHNEFFQIIFDDWNLSPRSMLWFEKSNINGPIYGSSVRPVVVSEGREFNLKFSVGLPASSSIRNYLGFKATYVILNNRQNIQHVITDCGGYDSSRVGGLVTFDPKMSTHDYYDCIWVLKRHRDYDMIYVKLIEFKSSPMFAPSQPDSLEIRGGLTSLGRHETTVTHADVDDNKLVAFENNTGFYIRLKGRYQNARDFVLAFASFRYADCYRQEFRCKNLKCIFGTLKCDGYDHCGDNSDETQSLCGTNPSDYPRYSYTVSIGVIIPMVISIFLIVVICLFIIFIRRCRTLSQQPQGARRSIPSVSGNMAANTRRNRHGRNRNRIRMNLTIQQDSPPSYDEVIRTTPIGYLNMAFMWSQPDVNQPRQTSPPTYEEATSPTEPIPSTGASLDQSTETSSNESFGSQSIITGPDSDTSYDGSDHTFRPRHRSFSSDSTIPEHDDYMEIDQSPSVSLNCSDARAVCSSEGSEQSQPSPSLKSKGNQKRKKQACTTDVQSCDRRSTETEHEHERDSNPQRDNIAMDSASGVASAELVVRMITPRLTSSHGDGHRSQEVMSRPYLSLSLEHDNGDNDIFV